MAVVKQAVFGATFELDKDMIAKIKTVASIAPKRTSMAILRSVMFVVDDGILSVHATDLEMWADVILSSEGYGDGSYVAILSLDAIKAIKAPAKGKTLPVAFKGDGAQTLVQLGDITYPTMGEYAEYPLTPKMELRASEAVTQEYITKFAELSLFASDSQVRPVLMGINHTGNSMQATNGLILGSYETDLAFLGNTSVNVPAFITKPLTKLFAGSEHIQFHVSDSHVQYSTPSTKFTVRRIDGTYPDISRIIQHNANAEYTIKRVDALVDAIKSIRPVVNECDNCITEFNFGDGYLLGEGKSTGAKVTKDLEGVIEHITGTTGAMAYYNAEYMENIFKAAKDGDTIQFFGAIKPMQIVAPGRTLILSPVLKR